MAMTIDGNGSITGLVAGGLPDATITQPDLASGVSGTGPAFRATLVAVNVTTATFTSFTSTNTPTFDTNSSLNTGTGRFQPTIAGYYQITVIADFGVNGVGAASSVTAAIGKNGSNYDYSGYANNASNFGAAICSTLVYLNGTTDYVQAQAYQNSGSTANGVNGRFSGFLARAA